MTKLDLIHWLVKEHPTLSLEQAEAVVHHIFQSIKDSIAAGNHVELRGFGSFTIKQHRAHIGRNPRTGLPVEVKAKRVPFFKPGKALREAGKQ
ncbi:MAG: HU family DNA-binding protein [Mariprofundaceae bacterium]|nr:HU family DNA-binding protein [Mariprofundaceae bacterium]